MLNSNTIEKIYFSSRFVEKEYRKHFRDLIERFPGIQLITLPSPSPRYAAMTKEEKIMHYKELMPLCDNCG